MQREFDAVEKVFLGEDVPHVMLDCADADTKLLRDLLVAESPRDRSGDARFRSITNGKCRVEMRPTNLVSVIETAIDTIAPSLVAKRIELHTEYDPEVGYIHGDADRLRQVLWNLLSNAAKFTPEEGHIEVRLERAGDCARLVVHDTGAGISREFLPYVFDRFR